MRNGIPVELTAKVFDTLLVLLENRDRVLSKRELMDSLWPDSFVEESNLFQNISTLRKTLGENPQEHQFIVTVPGRGYQFVATVGEEEPETTLVAPRISDRVVPRPAADEAVVVSEKFRSRIVIHDDGEDPGELHRSFEALPRIGPRIPPLSRQARWWMVGLGAVLLLSIGFLVFKTYKDRNEAPFLNPTLRKLTTSGNVISSAISPQGRDFVYVQQDDGKQGLWLRLIAASSSVQITPAESVAYHGLTFSPDGNQVYFVRSGPSENDLSSVFRVAALGGLPTKLYSDVDGPVALSPDGKLMAFTRGYPDQKESALVVANTDGSAERRLSTLKEPDERFILYAGPAWSPDGKTIVCARGGNNSAGLFQTLLAIDAATGSVKPLGGQFTQVRQAVWLPDGTGLVFVATEEELQPLQVWFVSYPGGSFRRITHDLNDYRELSLSHNGDQLLAVQTDNRSNLFLLRSGSQDPVAITNNNYEGLNGVAWTRDGRLVYTSLANGGENLWISNADGSNQRQITFSGSLNRNPAITPDGQSIIFSSERSGAQHLWRIAFDGSQPKELTHGTNDGHPAITPDGQTIFYRSYVDGIPSIFRMNTAGGEIRRVTDRISGFPTISPDGRVMACAFREKALAETVIALFSVASGELLKTLPKPNGPQHLAWTSDNSSILFLKASGGIFNVWLQPVNGETARQLTNLDSGTIYAFDATVDGALVLARGRRLNDVVLMSANK